MADILPITLATACLRLDELGETDKWTAFAMVRNYNTMRHLRTRKLVEDANDAARQRYAKQYSSQPEAPWEKYPPRYRLTAKGKAAVAKIKLARGYT